MSSVKISKNGLYGIISNNIIIDASGNTSSVPLSSGTTSGTINNYYFRLDEILEYINEIKVLDKDKDIPRIHLSILKYLLDRRIGLIKKYRNSNGFLYNKIIFFLFRINKKINIIEKEININKKALINSIKKLNNVEIKYGSPLQYYNKIHIKLKNGILHSIEEPAVKLTTNLSYYIIDLYYINGKEYLHEEWLNHPYRLGELRKLKLHKIHEKY